MFPDPPLRRQPCVTSPDAQLLVFGLSIDLLLLALLPLWLFLASLLPVLAAVGLGVLEAAMFYPALLLTGFACHTILLPLGAYRAYRTSERRREIADETMWRFASRITELYTATRWSPRIAADPRAAEAFRLYLLAGEELRSNHRRPGEARAKISRGTALADRALADVSASRR